METFDYEALEFNEEIRLKPLKAELEVRMPWLFKLAFVMGDHTGYHGTFGVRSGPCKGSRFSITHEVAHAIELTMLSSRAWKRRLQVRDFDMRVRGFVLVAGRRYHEAQTLESSMREIRTGAIQYHMLKAAGYDVTGFVKFSVYLLRHMADCDHGPGSAPINVPRTGHTPEQLHWIQERTALFEAEIAAISMDSILARWDLVMDWLQVKFAPQLKAGATPSLG